MRLPRFRIDRRRDDRASDASPPNDQGDGKGDGKGDPRRTWYNDLNVRYLIASVAALIVIQVWWGAQQQVAELDYSRFETLLEDGQVESVAISDDHIVGTLAEPLEEGGPTAFTTTRVAPDFAETMRQHDVTYDGRIESDFLPNLLSWLIPFALIFGLWWFMIRRMARNQQGMGGLMQIGKSKAKIYMERDTGSRFEDVAGIREAKQELEETVSFLADPEHYTRLGARQPKGILLAGPPGTGKTLLARAVAGEAGVPFFKISGSEFVEMFVGVGAARVRDLFEQAKQHAPCIIFIDELDAMGQTRGGGGSGMGGGGHDEKEQTLNQLLNEMDGFDPRTEIVVLAATNQPQSLDPALMRAGRFDRQVMVDRPDKRGRREILAVHAGKVKLSDTVDLEQVAGLTPGFTGADLENLVNEAAIIATRENATAVTTDHFTAATERLVAGLEHRSRLLKDDERRVIAHHEMGHAIVARVLPGVDPVHKISIIPRGMGALGFTMQRPTEDRYLMREDELVQRMTVLFGGRAAEMIQFGRVTTGASDDISKATDIARQIATQFGMDEGLGPVTYEEPRRDPLGQQFGPRRAYADTTAERIDAAVQGRLQDALDRARAILEANRAVLDQGAAALLEQETLEGEGLDSVLDAAHLPDLGHLRAA
ncbi:ATP-dependent zinc metalloprotease FtsH [Roseospira navarrensis]|uniref:ATP-dependent zinc metalloprotease FtsH n=1 Tax=Roseospira navarrensis TaxID=140058 RepID=A0A7X1ZHN2_9PROT|nr:ATP-dependent zinc metalloprotease FtsH [Roseospira navarrensis]MQX38433.1 ATP-dependent zinc metalloprotease FtsH [Roseospira navarrensis]